MLLVGPVALGKEESVGELPSGTVTLLFADVEGSTRLVQQLGAGYGGVLGDLRRLLRRAVAEAAGEEVDCRADELFAVFRGARDAVAAAVAAQRYLGRRRGPRGSGPGSDRLHTGEPAVVGGAYLGVDVTVQRGSVRPDMAARSCCRRRRATWSSDGVELRDLALSLLRGCPAGADLPDRRAGPAFGLPAASSRGSR